MKSAAHKNVGDSLKILYCGSVERQMTKVKCRIHMHCFNFFVCTVRFGVLNL